MSETVAAEDTKAQPAPSAAITAACAALTRVGSAPRDNRGEHPSDGAALAGRGMHPV